MFKNYIVTAWKVFQRRKFFTFINIFGISMTLAVIMVASTIADSYLYPSGPEKSSRNYLVLDRITLTNDEHSSTYGGGPGYKFIQDNVQRLASPEVISISSHGSDIALYQNDQKLKTTFRRTDANFWQVMDFNFIEGRPFDQQEFESGKFVAVITQQVAKELFGHVQVIGNSLEISTQNFKIIGVVENVSVVERNAFSGIWVPYTTMPSTDYRQETRGSWQVILYHSDASRLSEIQSEYIHLLKNDLVLENTDGLTTVYGGAFTKLEAFSSRLFAPEYTYETGKEPFLLVISIILLLFMLLPSINMINLNVSRIMERASEIGVRKAFGASSKQLVSQFLVENLLLTIVGGLVGMALSAFILQLIENAGLIPYAQFGINWRVFLWGSMMIGLFALISGAYPALKMSRLPPVQALKGGV